MKREGEEERERREQERRERKGRERLGERGREINRERERVREREREEWSVVSHHLATHPVGHVTSSCRPGGSFHSPRDGR